MFQSLTTRLSIAAALALTASSSLAAIFPVDVANPINGLTSIFSTTFDGPLPPCGGGASVYCTWFGGDPTLTRGIGVAPNPSKVINAVPGGIGPLGIPVAPVPAAGSFLDLTLGGGNTTLTLGVSTIAFADNDICIVIAESCVRALVHTIGAGIVFNPTGPANGAAFTPAGGGSTGGTVPVDVNGKAVFMVQNAGTIVVDFSRFSQVVTSCTDSGPNAACALITLDVLNLDVARYVLEIDFDPTFTSFTGRFIGGTGNNSIFFATLNSAGSDQDADGLVDTADNCPRNANPLQENGDGDTRGNVCDNCLVTGNTVLGVVPNSPGLLKSQLDADSDGFGSRCDSDFNNTGPASNVNTTDYSILRSVINKAYLFSFNAAKSDLNGDGVVNTTDYSIFRTQINKVPGPSGLACAGTIPCPPAPGTTAAGP